MVFRLTRIGGTLALATALAGTAQAQTNRLHLGPRVSYQFDLEKAGVGVQLGVPIARYLEFYPSFDLFFVDRGSFWHINADLKYRIAAASVSWLYIGGGLNIARSGFGTFHDTRTGLNLFVGAESLRGRVHPFGEFRFIANDGSTTQIAVGLNFTLRRH
ncbi:MAG: hypothetical protein HOP28_11940 [Gemmatimonadales bacterium]|nr:hypothetical protein [Gemmatimonadales bacterium]